MRKNHFKPLVRVFLAVIMLMSLIPMSAMAVTYNDDGNITSTSFTLNNFVYGGMVISANAVSETSGPLSIAFVEKTAIYESTKATPTSKEDLTEITSSDFQAGKQYFCAIEFSVHPDLAEGITFDRALTATLTCNGVLCDQVLDLSENNKIFVYKLPILEAVPYGIDVTTVIVKGGDVAPTNGAFELEILNVEEGSNLPISMFTIGGKDISTNGTGNFDSKLTIVNNDYEKLFSLFSYEGILVKQKKGTAEGWTYDESVWFVQFHQDPVVNALNDDVATFANVSFDCIKGKMVNDEFVADSQTPVNKITFTNTYTEAASTPETGDDSMICLWIALLFVSGVVGTTLFSKKRRSAR